MTWLYCCPTLSVSLITDMNTIIKNLLCHRVVDFSLLVGLRTESKHKISSISVSVNVMKKRYSNKIVEHYSRFMSFSIHFFVGPTGSGI